MWKEFQYLLEHENPDKEEKRDIHIKNKTGELKFQRFFLTIKKYQSKNAVKRVNEVFVKL